MLIRRDDSATGMAYRFKHRETVSQNVKRIAAEELDSTIALLKRKRGEKREDSIHEVRKSIKKIRALMRMVRGDLGDFFRDGNVRLRDAGQKVSELRDAGALIGTVDSLRRRGKKSRSGESLSSVRRLLAMRKQQLEDQAAAQKLLPALAVELRKTRSSIRYWPLETDGFAAIAEGLERTFRDGRKAFALARKTGKVEDFHEWRKRVKDHWYQIRLLNRLWGDVMSGYQQSLKELEDALGEGINLALLENLVRQQAPEGTGNLPVASIHKLIESARRELRERALETGKKVYAEKPRHFVRHLRRLWKAW
jgi:CHAD domain-containing protein